MMGSDVEISGLNNGSGDPPCAVPKCSELVETANPEVSEMGNFDFIDSESESNPCLGKSSVDAKTSSGRRDPPSAVPSGLLARESRPRMSHLKLLWRTLKCPRDCTNWLRLLVPARPFQAPFVVDAAPHDVKDMSEGLLATMIIGTELEGCIR